MLAGSLEVGDQKCTKSAYSVKQIDAEKSFSLDSPLGRIFLYNLLLGFNDLLKFIFLRKNTNMWFLAFSDFRKMDNMTLPLNVQKPKVFQLQGTWPPDFLDPAGVCTSRLPLNKSALCACHGVVPFRTYTPNMDLIIPRRWTILHKSLCVTLRRLNARLITKKGLTSYDGLCFTANRRAFRAKGDYVETFCLGIPIRWIYDIGRVG